MHVLVVDDEPTNREVAEVILQSVGHTVETAENGAEALELCIAQGRQFDCILMDVLMPELDGIKATSRLRANPTTSAVPILMVSAKASAAEQAAGFAAGCDFYLSKPYKRSQLVEAIATSMRQRTKV